MEQQELVSVSSSHHEPEWFIKRRIESFKKIDTLPLLQLQRFKYNTWPLCEEKGLLWQDSSKDLYQETSKADFKIVQLGQTTLEVKIPAELKAKGVILTDIFTALVEYPEITKKYLYSVLDPNTERDLAYNAAFMNSGIFLYVPKNLELKKPIEVEIIQDSTSKNALVSHIVLVAGENSNLKFLEHLSTIGEEHNSANLVVEIVALSGSHIEFSSIDEMSRETTLYFNRRANLGSDAHIEWNMALLNGCNTVGDVTSELLGEGSYAYSKVIAVTTNDQQVAINNQVINRGPHTTGLINQRGVLLEDSKLILNGIGQIIHGAHGSKADQENRVLMMSDKAQGDANPLLLIDENDVIAAHAASVGPVDPIQMNYLMTRGIPYVRAERMVIHGFLDAVLGAIPKGKVRERMLEILERKLIDGQKKYYGSQK